MKIETIKKYMKENKITYEELSQKSGVSISTIKKVFAGISPYPRLDTVQAIENALGLSDDITAEDITNGWVSIKKANLTPQEDEWLAKRSQILSFYGEEGLKTVSAMIDAYIGAKTDSNKQ